jgi:hypothetical protein
MRRYLDSVFLLSFLVFVTATSCFAQNELIFPLIVNSFGSGANYEYWLSFTSVFNANDQPATVTFTMYDSNGNIVGSPSTVTVGAFQAEAVPPGIPLRTGWLKVTSSQPLIGSENIQFRRVSGAVQDVRSKIYLSPDPPGTRHLIRLEAFGPVGVSIVFPSAASGSSARGKIIHRETDGSIVSQKDLVIAPNGQLIAYLPELLQQPVSVPPLPPAPPLAGSIEIVFDQNVALTALQFAASEPLEEPIEALPGAVPSQ